MDLHYHSFVTFTLNLSTDGLGPLKRCTCFKFMQGTTAVC